MMMMMTRLVFLLAFGAGAPPAARPVGDPEIVARFDGPMPTGVAVSAGGRVFVNFPRWGDKVDFTVAEVVDGKAKPYPDAAFNRFDKADPGKGLVSVQSVVIDGDGRLWLLDTGSIEMGPVLRGGPKLVCVDLATDRVVKTIAFPEDVALKTTYLNDVRFDLRVGKAGTAYITDSSDKGPNAIIVVDLATGKGRRRLEGHPSTRADKGFRAVVEGRPLMERPKKGEERPLAMGADGIAISADGKHLYYCPLASRRLYRVATDRLRGEGGPEPERLEDRGFASDGLESDSRGRLYLTDYEHNAVLRRGADGKYETLAHGLTLLWPDTLAVADGWVYFTANQLHRQKKYQEGVDKREKPYILFRVKADAKPVRLATPR